MKTSLEQKSEQKNKILKANVALAMRDEFGKLPKEEIENIYRMARVLYKAVLGTHYIQKKDGQLVLF